MINRFKQIVSVMTYRDMKDLSTLIAERLPAQLTAEAVADTLLKLPIDTEDAQLEKTNKILGNCFSRKKQIIIQPEHHPVGGTIYKITCPSVEGAVVFESNIREGVSQLLDTLTVLQAFNDG